MSVLRVRDSQPLRSLQVAMIGIVGMTVAGSFFLLSAQESQTLVDGAVDWRAESPLRAVVQLLCLNYRFPTINPGDIKNYVLGIGAGLALLALTVAVLARNRADDDSSTEETASSAPDLATGSQSSTARQGATRKVQVTPAVAAQLAMGLYLLWSFASSRWSAAPELSVGGSLLLTIHFLWAFALGHGLNPTAARIASRFLIAITAITALIALWYFYGRNWTIRAKFPFGNPNFLSACLIPGIMLSITLLCETISGIARSGSTKSSVATVLAVFFALAVGIWTFALTESRGPALGLCVGIIAVAFFALRGRARLFPLGVMFFAVLVAGMYFYSRQHAASPGGRDATIRFRAYAWSYAWRMFAARPVTGHGQGGFVLAGDSHVAAESNGISDVLRDPLVFTARVEHAHNEWLEVMADLGLVGMGLLAASLLLTFRTGVITLTAHPPPAERWTLIGLLASLAGLIAEESFGVGLRVSGVPTAFYTVLGLIWALSGDQRLRVFQQLPASRPRRWISGVVGGTAGMLTLILNHQDFQAARQAHTIEEKLAAEKYDEAVLLAAQATDRLNPQRALTNIYRLAEAQMLIARILEERARDRETRGRGSDLMDPRLLALASKDRAESERNVADASRTLKELVKRSPGFLNHGWLEYSLNLIQADHAAARNYAGERQLAIRNAVAAIERELRRQPFAPDLALDYVRVAAASMPFEAALEALARPLRHHRVSPEYLELLSQMAGNPEFDQWLARTLQAIAEEVAGPTPSHAGSNDWFPETLRLAGGVWFLRGDYKNAQDALEAAARAYEDLGLAEAVSLGVASCYGELADCRFFHQPDAPAMALAGAENALRLAPESQSGRRLRQHVRQRMIDYFLAETNEADATRLLQEIAPSATSEMLPLELGARYRRLCESLLRRREGQVLRKPAAGLLPQLQRWASRALELNEADGQAHFLAADLAFYAGDDEATATHLYRALDNGLPSDVARRFLELAREQRPDSALEMVWKRLETEGGSKPSAGN